MLTALAISLVTNRYFRNSFFLMKKLFFIISFFTLSSISVSFGQKSDSLKTIPDTAKKHSTMTATIMSAIVPGLGQVYNRKYWKVPIVYGGLLTAGYFLKINRDAYRELKVAYIATVDADSTTLSKINLNESGLKTYMDFYRTRMEICYIAFGMLYVLNIVDATVDAHLFTFDVSDDLSLKIMPEFNASLAGKIPSAGLRLNLRF